MFSLCSLWLFHDSEPLFCPVIIVTLEYNYGTNNIEPSSFLYVCFSSSLGYRKWILCIFLIGLLLWYRQGSETARFSSMCFVCGECFALIGFSELQFQIKESIGHYFCIVVFKELLHNSHNQMKHWYLCMICLCDGISDTKVPNNVSVM